MFALALPQTQRELPALLFVGPHPAVNGLVRNPHPLVSRKVQPQPPGDLLRRPSQRQLLPHVAGQRLILQLPRNLRRTPTPLGLALSAMSQILSRLTITPQLPTDRALVPVQFQGH